MTPHRSAATEEPCQQSRKRARLAEIERELARLRHCHDIAMSAFKFEEATALGPGMAALENELRMLAAQLPEPGDAPPPSGVAPVLARPRRRRR